MTQPLTWQDIEAGVKPVVTPVVRPLQVAAPTTPPPSPMEDMSTQDFLARCNAWRAMEHELNAKAREQQAREQDAASKTGGAGRSGEGGAKKIWGPPPSPQPENPE